MLFTQEIQTDVADVLKDAEIFPPELCTGEDYDMPHDNAFRVCRELQKMAAYQLIKIQTELVDFEQVDNYPWVEETDALTTIMTALIEVNNIVVRYKNVERQEAKDLVQRILSHKKLNVEPGIPDDHLRRTDPKMWAFLNGEGQMP